MRNKILLAIYFAICLLSFPAGVRWGGWTSDVFLFAVGQLLVLFYVPILFARLISAVYSRLNHKPYVEVFNFTLTVIVLCCVPLVGFYMLFGLTFKF